MNKKLTKIISFILAIILIITLPFTAYAESGNGTGDNGTAGSHHVTGGASSSKAAYLIYIVDKNGSLLTPVVEAAISGAKEPPLNANFDYEISKFGNQAPSSFDIIYDVPTPFTSGGDGNGAVLKNKLLELDEGRISYRAIRVIENYFGADLAEQFINSNSDMYLIFEGVYWLTMNNGTHSGETLVATASGWAKAQNDYGCGEYGSSTFTKYTNNIFANCMKFEFSQLGLSPCPSGKQTNDVIMGNYKWKGKLELLNIIMVGVSGKLSDKDENNELHRLLGTLLSEKLKVDKKLDILENEYDIPMEESIEEEVKTMCNLSEGIEERGIIKGRAVGRAE